MTESRPGIAWVGERQKWRLEGEIAKWSKETSGGNRYVHNVEGGDGFTVYTNVKTNETKKALKT